MLRTAIVGAIAALLLPATLVAATPTPASAGRDFKPWGYTRAPDQVLRSGCHNYRYTYKVDPPGFRWAAEVFLIDPRGVGLASAAFLKGGDPKQGSETWRICRASTKPGRFKMKMKVTYCEERECRSPTDPRRGYVKPSYFRLTRPG